MANDPNKNEPSGSETDADKLRAAIVSAQSAANSARWTGIVAGITALGSVVALVVGARIDPLQHRLDYVEQHEKLYSDTLAAARPTLQGSGNAESRFVFMQLYSVVQSARDNSQRQDEKLQLVQLVGLTKNAEVKRVFIGLRLSDPELDRVAAQKAGVYALSALANETAPPATPTPTPRPTPSPSSRQTAGPKPSRTSAAPPQPTPKPTGIATVVARPSPTPAPRSVAFARDISEETSSEKGLLQSAIAPKTTGWVYLGFGHPDATTGSVKTIEKSQAIVSRDVPAAGQTVQFCREVHVRDSSPTASGLGRIIGATKVGSSATVSGAPVELQYHDGKVVWAPVTFVDPPTSVPPSPCP